MKSQALGILGTQGITKFLANRQEEVVKRFAPLDKPQKLLKNIEVLL